MSATAVNLPDMGSKLGAEGPLSGGTGERQCPGSMFKGLFEVTQALRFGPTRHAARRTRLAREPRVATSLWGLDGRGDRAKLEGEPASGGRRTAPRLERTRRLGRRRSLQSPRPEPRNRRGATTILGTLAAHRGAGPALLRRRRLGESSIEPKEYSSQISSQVAGRAGNGARSR